jgi:hypothetical protein
MPMLNPDSMAETLAAASDALFWGREISKADRDAVVRWLVSRQGLEGCYAGTFLPPEDYRGAKFALFTGETRGGNSSTKLILGNEACRVLTLLGTPTRAAADALDRAREGMWARTHPKDRERGIYCCKRCTPAVWRNFASWRSEGAEGFLAAGVRTLRGFRIGEGGWGVFPPHYTLLALTEIDLPEALDELRYAAPACEKGLSRPGKGGLYDCRRRELWRRVLDVA